MRVRGVYLAARYGRRLEMLEKAADVRSLGHVVTARWIEGHDDEGDGDFTHGHDGRAALWAQKDYNDVARSDVVISFTEGGGGRGGRHVEFGIALALDKRCLIVGPAEHLFHWTRGVEHYATWEAALARLDALTEEAR